MCKLASWWNIKLFQLIRCSWTDDDNLTIWHNVWKTGRIMQRTERRQRKANTFPLMHAMQKLWMKNSCWRSRNISGQPEENAGHGRNRIPNLICWLISRRRLRKEKAGASKHGQRTIIQNRLSRQSIIWSKHGVRDYNEIEARLTEKIALIGELSAFIKEKENRLAEISVLKTHIINYSKTKDVYVFY